MFIASTTATVPSVSYYFLFYYDSSCQLSLLVDMNTGLKSNTDFFPYVMGLGTGLVLVIIFQVRDVI